MSSHGDIVEPVIFREYIVDLESFNTFPSDIVNSNIKEFHFILGFAHETYNEARKGTGVFTTCWDSEFTKQKVKDIKNQHPNVKVVISIGGRDDDDDDDDVVDDDDDDVDDGDTYPFSPIEKHLWCNHAYDSLKKIIQLYNGSDANCCHKLIDGIDIYYEHINTLDEYDFTEYIKEVIPRLKEEGIIDVVSIAPSHETHKHYRRLYSACSDDIKWVNYQFYMQPIPTKAEFLNLFYSLSREYGSAKLLAGASVDPCDAGNVSQDVFLESCTDLVKSKLLSGIFIWNANDSASNSNEDKPFDLEKIAQDILTKLDVEPVIFNGNANHSIPKLAPLEDGLSCLVKLVTEYSFSIDAKIHLAGAN